MSKKNKNKDEFYKEIQQEQRLIDIEEIAHEKLEGEYINIPGSNKGLS